MWCHDVTSHDVTTSYCDVTCCNIIGHVTQMGPDMSSYITCLITSNEILPGDLDLWLTTLTYNPSLAKVKVNCHTKNQDQRSNSLAMRVFTHTHTDGKTALTLSPRPLTREVKIHQNWFTRSKIRSWTRQGRHNRWTDIVKFYIWHGPHNLCQTILWSAGPTPGYVKRLDISDSLRILLPIDCII